MKKAMAAAALVLLVAAPLLTSCSASSVRPPQVQTRVTLTPVAGVGDQINSATMAETARIIRERLARSGVSGAEVTSPDARTIVVVLPGSPDQATLDLVSARARMGFRPVLAVAAPDAATPSSATATPDGAPTSQSTDVPTATPTSASDPAYVTPGLIAVFDSMDCTNPANRRGGADDPMRPLVACDPAGTAKYVLGPVEIEGKDIAKASSNLHKGPNDVTTNQWVVSLQFSSDGAKKFASITTRMVSANSPFNQFAMVLDGRVVSAPSVQSAILDGQAEISGGDMTRASAANLANQLSLGELPLTLTVQSEQPVTSTAGSR